MKIVLVLVNVIFTCSTSSESTEMPPSLSSYLFPSEQPYQCPEFPFVENGNVLIKFNGNIASLSCKDGYDLVGQNTVYCNYGSWTYDTMPKCEKQCPQPPSVENGELVLDALVQEQGRYAKGTVVTYTCNRGFFLDPPTSKMRVCERGIWTGPVATCKSQFGCPSPQPITNGRLDYASDYSVSIMNGQIASYICEPGYTLVGPKIITCTSEGTWSPHTSSRCEKNSQKIYDLDTDDIGCDTLPTVPYSTTKLVKQYDPGSLINAVVEITCFGKYRNSRHPCQASKLKCKDGRWLGPLPTCVPAHECFPPPPVPNAVVAEINYENNYDSASPSIYPIRSQVTYRCNNGYMLEGNPLLTCQSSGCWEPNDVPVCIKSSEDEYIFAMTNSRSTLVSAAAGAGVLSLLTVFCVLIACRRRKVARGGAAGGQSGGPTRPPAPSNDHVTLLGRPPDRLALIAFADGVAGSQNTLPTYEEAVRNERNATSTNGGLTVSGRFHRPHWPSLGGRRTRNSPNPDVMHIVRHGSFASHTPSIRSGGDSMGSTDTMAVSEGSTNVTLDTASSHSGSQNPSCRVHCGSLASFDTCSVINTEDVPLLEENEFEEIQGGNNEADNPIVSDNISSKISTNSAPILST